MVLLHAYPLSKSFSNSSFDRPSPFFVSITDLVLLRGSSKLSDEMQLGIGQAIILHQLNLRLDPELRLSLVPLHMDVHPGPLAGKEIEPKAALSEDSRTQSFPPDDTE